MTCSCQLGLQNVLEPSSVQYEARLDGATDFIVKQFNIGRTRWKLVTAVSRTERIDAPVETVYRFLEDADFLEELAPTAISTQAVGHTSSGGQQVKCTHKVHGITFDETVEFNWAEQENRIVELSDSPLLKSQTTYQLDPIDGRTKAEITADINVPIPVIGRLAEQLLIHVLIASELEGILSNLKEFAERDDETA